MKLPKSAIKEIGAGLDAGQFCEVSLWPDGLVKVNRCSNRQDIDFQFPMLVATGEPSVLKLTKEEGKDTGQIVLAELRVPTGYWVLGIKGAAKTEVK